MRLFIDMSVMEESKTYSKSFSIDISWSLKCAREVCETVPDCFRPFLVHNHFKKDGRFFRLVYLIWKKRQKNTPFFPGDRSVQEECAKSIPIALTLLSFRSSPLGTCNDGGFEPRCSCDACPLLTDFFSHGDDRDNSTLT